jgi:hypothetical protein
MLIGMYCYAASSGGWLPRLAAWASWPGMTWPVPSHQGHVTVCAEPPRRETMRPVPRQGGQGLVSVSVVVASSSAIGG